MKRFCLVIIAMFACAALLGCAKAQAPAVTPTATPAATPSPTPEPTPEPEADYSGYAGKKSARSVI